MPEAHTKALLDSVKSLTRSQQGKLYYQCQMIDKENLCKNFHQNLGSTTESILIIFELLKNKPEQASVINADHIPVHLNLRLDELSGILCDHKPNNKPFISQLILKLEIGNDHSLLHYLFANLAIEQVNHKIISLFLSNNIPALDGLMHNSCNDVIEKIMSYNGEQFQFKEEVIRYLKLRIQQINGSVFENQEITTGPYEPIIRKLNDNNEALKNKCSSIWDHPYCDNMNSLSTNFKVPKNFSTINLIDISDINYRRALIGRGFILINSNSRAMVYELTQEKKHDLEDHQFTTISDELVIVCNDTLLYFYKSDGSLIHVDVLENSIALPPKTSNNKLYIVDMNSKFYVYDLNTKSFCNQELIKLAVGVQIIDYIVYEDHTIFVTPNSFIIKSGTNLNAAVVENEISSIIGGSNYFYLITNKEIRKYDFSSKQLSSYTFLANPSTNVVLMQENKLAFGYGERLITVIFDEVNARQDQIYQLDSRVNDLIVCDGTLTVICENGELFTVNDGVTEKIDLNSHLLDNATLSVGSGVMCISSKDKLYVCKISA